MQDFQNYLKQLYLDDYLRLFKNINFYNELEDETRKVNLLDYVCSRFLGIGENSRQPLDLNSNVMEEFSDNLQNKIYDNIFSEIEAEVNQILSSRYQEYLDLGVLV